MTVQVDSIFAVPSEIPDQKTTATLLAGVTGEDADSLLEHMQAQKNFAWIARKVDGETAARVKSLNLRGIYFQKELKRFYPKRGLARAGARLRGHGRHRAGRHRASVPEPAERREGPRGDHHGRAAQVVRARGAAAASRARTWCSPSTKRFSSSPKRNWSRRWRIRRRSAGTVVVQNPRTGEILALANAPSFNPNLSREITPEKLKNHAVSDVYEPGSVFKTVDLFFALR